MDFWEKVINDGITIGVLVAIALFAISKITKKSIGNVVKDLISWFKEVGEDEE